ncbi:MAG: carboxypeptidase-like regulatory domain-containing protein [Chitinophagaceae bacterium]|nr:carboxypeptidase-like regulatory domain-containing protein [Chitinophagaceae bacterium]
MSEERNHINYNASDIRRYLDGDMSASEMHSIEKAALDDPFLADAIEGIQSARLEHSDQTIVTNLEKLKADLSAKTEQGKVVRFGAGWWKIAAAASVLLILSVVAYRNWFDTSHTKEAITLSDVSTPSVQSETKGSDSLNKQEDTQQQPAAILPTPPNSSDATATRESVVLERDSKGAPHPTVSEAKNSKFFAKADTSVPVPIQEAAKEVAADVVRMKDNEETERKTTSPSANAGINDRFYKNNAVNTFNGRVLDTNNQPLANAMIQLSNTNNGYLSDDKGNFAFASTDSLVDVNVLVVGYASQNFTLRNSVPSNQLKLIPQDSQLSEVVVTSKQGSAKKQTTKSKTIFPKVLVQDAEPVIGWIEFDRYIEANKKNVPGNKIGEVVLSFELNKQSQLSKYKVEQSLSPAQDEDALRLLKEGPGWRLLKGKKTRVIVIIRF